MVCIFHIKTGCGDLQSKFSYPVQIWENTGEKKFRIQTIFMQLQDYLFENSKAILLAQVADCKITS